MVDGSGAGVASITNVALLKKKSGYPTHCLNQGSAGITWPTVISVSPFLRNDQSVASPLRKKVMVVVKEPSEADWYSWCHGDDDEEFAPRYASRYPSWGTSEPVRLKNTTPRRLVPDNSS